MSQNPFFSTACGCVIFFSRSHLFFQPSFPEIYAQLVMLIDYLTISVVSLYLALSTFYLFFSLIKLSRDAVLWESTCYFYKGVFALPSWVSIYDRLNLASSELFSLGLMLRLTKAQVYIIPITGYFQVLVAERLLVHAISNNMM